MKRKKTAPNGLRKIIRRSELYGFDNRAIAFSSHVNLFKRAGIVPSEANRYHRHQPIGNNAVLEGKQYSIDDDRRWNAE